jgi:hypothetical protein
MFCRITPHFSDRAIVGPGSIWRLHSILLNLAAAPCTKLDKGTKSIIVNGFTKDPVKSLDNLWPQTLKGH